VPTGWLACDAELVDACVASSIKEETGRFGTERSAEVSCACKLVVGSLMRVRLQGAAPLGGNFDDDIVDSRLRTIIHPEMNNNPSRAMLPRPILRTGNGKLLPGSCVP